MRSSNRDLVFEPLTNVDILSVSRKNAGNMAEECPCNLEVLWKCAVSVIMFICICAVIAKLFALLDKKYLPALRCVCFVF